MKYYTNSENKTCKFYIAGREKLEQPLSAIFQLYHGDQF
jgi:hypothetical protein